MKTIPKKYAAVATLCAKRATAKYDANAVQYWAGPNGEFSLSATDGKSAIRIDAKGAEFPGRVLIPGPVWRKVLQALQRGEGLVVQPARGDACAADLHTVRGDIVVGSFGSITSGDRFPGIVEAVPDGEPVASARADASRLAALLKVLATLSEDEYRGVTLEFHGPGKPLVVRLTEPDLTAVGLLNPLEQGVK